MKTLHTTKPNSQPPIETAWIFILSTGRTVSDFNENRFKILTEGLQTEQIHDLNMLWRRIVRKCDQFLGFAQVGEIWLNLYEKTKRNMDASMFYGIPSKQKTHSVLDFCYETSFLGKKSIPFDFLFLMIKINLRAKKKKNIQIC